MYATFDTDFGVEYSPSTFRLVVFSLLEHTWTFQSWLESLSLPQRRAKTTALNSPHLVCPQLWPYLWLVQNQPWSGHNIWQIPGTASNVETSRGKHCITNVAVDVSSQETWHCELYIHLFFNCKVLGATSASWFLPHSAPEDISPVSKWLAFPALSNCMLWCHCWTLI